jgi:protein-tyrosine phosphatase
MTVSIITVCTGNICRSPYAERALAHRLDEVRPGSFVVTSVGTGALVGEGIDPGSVRALEARGIRHDGFEARLISEQLLKDVDLVLPMTVEHRRTVLSYAPSPRQAGLHDQGDGAAHRLSRGASALERAAGRPRDTRGAVAQDPPRPRSRARAVEGAGTASTTSPTRTAWRTSTSTSWPTTSTRPSRPSSRSRSSDRSAAAPPQQQRRRG